MNPGRIPFDLAPQHSRKRRGIHGCRMGLSRRLHDRPAFRMRGVAAGLANSLDPIRGRLRIADLDFGQARADSGFDTHQEFDAFETSQTEIAVEPRMQRYASRSSVAAEFAHHRCDCAEDSSFCRVGRSGRGGVHPSVLLA